MFSIGDTFLMGGVFLFHPIIQSHILRILNVMIRCILLLLTVVSLPLHAQIGDPFPAISAETVKDEIVNIPSDTEGKYTLIGMAYSKKSEDDLNTWFAPVYQKFVYKPEKPGLFDSFRYDINVYFIPMFTGIKAAGQGVAKKKALKNIDQRLFPHILFYKGELKKYKEALDFEKKDIPYFFLLDKAGNIVYATSGEFNEDKLDDIEDNIDE